jgi:trans-aconitate methyltransferase
MRVLDLGCGTGGVTRLLLARGALVTGVDGSPQMLARAKRRAPDATFVCSMLEDYEPSGSFDRVLFAFVLHELSSPSRHAVLALAQRAVAPGGVVAIPRLGCPTDRRSALSCVALVSLEALSLRALSNVWTVRSTPN